MAYTGMPGYYGVDEEQSEMTLGFWYLFQESLWSIGPDEYDDEEEVVTEPQAVEPAPKFRDPYIEIPHEKKGRREGTLASRTGSRPGSHGKGGDAD